MAGKPIGATLTACALAIGSVGAALAQVEVPASRRSQAAVERARPVLESELRAQNLRLGAPLFVRIFKQERVLEVWLEGGDRFELFRAYEICAYSGALGPKLRQGDNQAPEGFYFVRPEQMNPSSRFHLSFNLGYPNAFDRAHGRTGSFLMVHGSCVSIGCYAMTDGRIEEIWTLADAALRGGQPFLRVHVFPFRMTDENMQGRGDSPWLGFWQNLKEGYDWFEREHRPPNVTVRDKRYRFAGAN